jgi:hypothetical protein
MISMYFTGFSLGSGARLAPSYSRVERELPGSTRAIRFFDRIARVLPQRPRGCAVVGRRSGPSRWLHPGSACPIAPSGIRDPAAVALTRRVA